MEVAGGMVIGERVRPRSAQAGHGSAVSFDEFYAAHYGPVLALAYALSGSWPMAEESAQEAFLRAFRNWDRVRGFERPGSWIRTVAANLARSRLRRIRAELRALTRWSGRIERPHDDVRLPDVSREVWAAVRSLPRRQAEVVVLHYLEDASVDDVASILGIAAGTVKAHLHHARRALAERLDAAEDLP